MAEGDYSFKAVINADTTSFQRNIKQAQSSVTSLSNTFGGLSKVITKALSFVGITASVGAIVKFGKESIKAADSANKSFNVLNNTIKATGATAWTTTDDIVQMSKELADSSNYAVCEIQDMQSVLLGFRNITGDTFEEASEAIMDMATVMGMDLKSATQTVGKALDDPIKGLDSLRRQGFQFTDEQKAQLEQLVKNGKQLEAQKIILDELSTTYGGAAKAAQSSFARMRNATTELKETLGNQLMPVINEITNNATNNIKQLTAEIQKIDFSRMFGMIKNIANMVKPVFEDIINYFKDFGSEINGLFNSNTIKPFISLFDTLLGILKAIFNEIKSNFERVKETFASIKEGVGGIADTGALQKITGVINKIIDVVWFLHEQILKVQEEIRTIVFDAVKNIWNFIKQLFDNSNKALEENEKGFASWAEFFYSQFDQVFRIAQDLINGVSAILHGNWAAAWEYAKLSAMRAAKVLLDTVSQIANSFPNLINKIIDALNKLIEGINKVRGFFGDDPLGLIESFKSVDLTESSGLGKAISDTEKKIEELTGKAADVPLKSLKGISQISQGMTSQIISDITDVTDTYVSNSQKQYATALNTNSGIESDTENAYEKYSEWDSKLLQQRQENLKEWSKEYHEINLQLIEEQRKKALEEDKTGANTAKINKYYDNMILGEKKRYFGAVVDVAKNTVKKVTEFFKKMVDTIKNVISSTINIFGRLFEFNPDEALDNLLVFEDKVLTFFVETLQKLPGFVNSVLQSISVLIQSVLNSGGLANLGNILSSILTSIIAEAPKIIKAIMPVIESIVNSISSTIMNMGVFDTLLDWIVEGIERTFKRLVSLVPKILKMIINIVSKLLKKLPEIIKIVIPSLSKIIIEIVQALPALLKAIIPNLLTAVLELVKSLLKELPKIIATLIDALPEIITTVIDALVQFLSNLTSKDIALFVKGVIQAVTQIASALIRNVGKIVAELIPLMVQIIVELIKSIPDILKGLATGVWEGIKDIGASVWEGIKSVGEGIKNIGQSIVGGLKRFFGFATGTNSAPKGLALVGEAGPELVNFKGGEKVYNATNTQKMLAGATSGGNTFNVTFNNLRDTSAYAMMSQLRQYNRQMAINGII